MRMENDENERIRPVCKFGPGGVFISVWPPGSFELSKLSPNSRTRVLLALSRIMENLVASESGRIPKTPTVAGRPANTFDCGKGDSGNVIEKTTTSRPADAASGPAIKNHRPRSGEPLLFSDDRRIGGRVGHKPKHRIRAHRRAPKKGAAVGAGRQGSLFEVNFKSAKSA